MKNILTYLFFSLIAINITAQTVINTPIVNQYAAVTDIDFCNNAMRVANNAENLFAVGDYVLIIQMKGANINFTTFNNTFGNVTDYFQAGRYEFNYVKSINLGNINGLQFKNELSYPYDADKAVQVIKVPQYEDVIIQNTLSCLPWNGSIGGIVVFEASGNVDMQADIYVDEIGFRGGLYSNDNDCYTNTGGFLGYYCIASDNCGAFIGEGVGNLVYNNSKGRAKNANAGGGGNDHNAGGGGGANGGNGGRGGDNDLNTQFCSGFGGLGGQRNFATTTENRILMAGAGGAGDSNNNSGTEGGYGAGTVIINAQSLTANGFKISANGQDALAGSGDGTGGGGAGGTVILNIDTYTDNLLIQANGGNGGDNNDNTNCPGVGGGGAGGLLWVKQSSTPSNISFVANGGTKGNYTSTLCNGLDIGAENGEQGRAIFNFTPYKSTVNFMATTINAQKDSIICAGDSALLTASINSTQDYQFNWIENGTSFSQNNTLYIKPTERGNHAYTAQLTWNVFDVNCEENDIVNVAVRNPDIVIVLSPNSAVDVGNPVFLNGVINPISPNYTYSWNPNYVEPNTERNTVVEPFETTTFCLTVTDELGCTKTECKEVKVNIPPSGAPDAFTPNDDGVNDIFRIIPLPQLEQKSLKIYNRWGELLYESDSVFEWDGTIEGKAQNIDVYNWVAEFEHRNTKETAVQSGSFMLIR
ncbi:MAG: gliding motility-associated C-terminal domain-containing protein [Chitinophagales bacterium]